MRTVLSVFSRDIQQYVLTASVSGRPTFETFATVVRTYLNDFGHLLDVDDAVAVDVIHAEGPLELLLRRTTGRDIDRQQKLLGKYEY